MWNAVALLPFSIHAVRNDLNLLLFPVLNQVHMLISQMSQLLPRTAFVCSSTKWNVT